MSRCYVSSPTERYLFQHALALKIEDNYIWQCPYCGGEILASTEEVVLGEPFVCDCPHAGCHMRHNVNAQENEH